MGYRFYTFLEYVTLSLQSSLERSTWLSSNNNVTEKVLYFGSGGNTILFYSCYFIALTGFKMGWFGLHTPLAMCGP